MNHLEPCPHCARHIRIVERECPFCGADIDLSAIPAPVLPTRRLGRAALFTFGATLAAGLAAGACSDEDDSSNRNFASGGASNGGSGGVTPDSSYGGTGAAIYGCGPFGMKPNGMCNGPDTGSGGTSGASGAAGAGDSGLAGASAGLDAASDAGDSGDANGG